jgi:Tfp pilus assembly protein PilV
VRKAPESAARLISVHRPGDGTRGFTVMEVMLAAFILALVIATSITTLQRAFLSLDSARNLTLAGQIMQHELEKVRLKDWATVSAYTSVDDLTIDPVFTSNSYIANLIAHRGLRLSREVSVPETDIVQLTYTVTWRNYDGRELSRSYVTYYARYGMYDFFYNSSS